MTTRINFDEISIKGTKRWIDENGKRRQKTRKFYQTVNPFNIDADGNIKTREQIWDEIKAECVAWESEDELNGPL